MLPTKVLLATLLIALPAHAFDLEGHRGARAAYPENTLAAFEYAIGVGVNTLEMDMQVTSDRVILISHDAYITPELCLDSKGQHLKEKIAIHTLTVEQAQSFDCGSLVNPRFPTQKLSHQKMPTLDQVFTMVETSKNPNAKKVDFNIETKIYPGGSDLVPPPDEFVDLFLTVVRQHHMLKRVILQSFDHRTLVIGKKKEPTMRIAALIAENLPNLAALAKDLKADIISPEYEWINAEVVAEVHKVGAKVIPWTVDEPADWKKVLAMGVDGIITDDPQGLQNFMKTQTPAK